MGRDVIMQYFGPFSIQTSDAATLASRVVSESYTIERGQIEEYEQRIVQEISQK